MNPDARERFRVWCKWVLLLGWALFDPKLLDLANRPLQDLVEIEEWNEYGELKEHIKIYHEGGAPTKSAAPTPSGTPSKAPTSMVQQIKTPEPAAAAESSKDVESKPPAGAQPTSFTLAMRQVGLEAAQKAKDAKKKVTETFTGVGEAEPEKKDAEKEDEAKTLPPPLSLTLSLSDEHPIIAPTVQQSPKSTAWTNSPDYSATPAGSANEMGKLQRGSLQSPHSTTWKPTDLDQPASTHDGSSVSLALKESKQKVEDDESISEEDEEDSEETGKE